MAQLIPFTIAALLVAAVHSENDMKWGPYDVQLDNITDCENKGNGDITLENLKVKMIGKHLYELSFEATNKVPFDDNIEVTVEVVSYKEKEGTFSSKVLSLPLGPACKALTRFFPKTYTKLFQHIGAQGCPVPPNTWHSKKFPLQFNIPITELMYNKFRSDVILQRDDLRLFCTRVFFTTVPEGTIKY